MSRIRADQILNSAGTGAPNFSQGLQVGAATTIHTTGIDLGSGNIQSHNINSVGIITAQAGIHVLGAGSSVSIGTASPEELLHIKRTNATPAIQLECVSGGTDYKGLIKLAGNDLEIRGSNGQMEFYTGAVDGDSSTARMFIQSNGRIHLGTRDGNQNGTVFGVAKVNIVGPDPIQTGFAATACYLQIGGTESEANGLYPIGFGFRGSSATHVPAYIAYKTTNSSSNERGDLLFATRSVVTDTEPSERLRITTTGQIEYSAAGGDNQFISNRTDTAGEDGNYFLHVRARNSTPVDVGYLGFHRDTAPDDSRFVVGTRATGDSVTERLRIDGNGNVTINNTGAIRARLDLRQAIGHPPFNIGFPDGSFYRNLGVVGPASSDGSTGQYLHIRLRTIWNDSSMTMFRVSGYYSYSSYAESYVGMYRYNNSNNRYSPYGPVISDQGNKTTIHSIYNTNADPGYLVIVCNWDTGYVGLMVEHYGAGSDYASYMQHDLEIIDTKRSSSTSAQW